MKEFEEKSMDINEITDSKDLNKKLDTVGAIVLGWLM